MKLSRCILALLSFLVGDYCSANTFNTEQWVTPNGVRVVFYPAMEVPMLDISLAFAAGSAYDQQQYGLSSLTVQMLNEGSAGRTSSELAEAIADTGAQFNTDTNRDMAIFSLRTLTSKEALTPAVKAFSQIVNHPDFPNNALAREKQQLIMALEQSTESPDELATQVFFAHLYQEHPYAHPVNGTEKTLQAITPQDIKRFYKQYYVGQNAVLVLVGALDSQTAHQLADIITHDLTPGAAAPAISKAKPLTKAQAVSVPFPSSQTILRLGQLGVDYQNPNYFPLMVGNYILGGGNLVSRLASEIRGNKGLAYTVDSQLVPMPGIGPFFISFSTQSQQAKDALSLTYNLLKSYVADGPTQSELDAAKKYLVGSFPLSLASNRTIASILLRMTFYKLPQDYLDTYLDKIKQVSTDDIKRAFQQEIHPDKFLEVKVGPS